MTERSKKGVLVSSHRERENEKREGEEGERERRGDLVVRHTDPRVGEGGDDSSRGGLARG